MKKQEYLVAFKNKETLELIYTFYIKAVDLNNAQEIANDLTHDYEDEIYFEILASVDQA